MRTVISSVLTSLLFFAPLTALAAEVDQVELRLQGEAVVDEMSRVEIELTDAKGRPSVGDEPELIFSPEEAVADVQLYDCGDSAVFANCRPNNRAVGGLYEVHFMVLSLPAQLMVNVGDVGQAISLGSGELVDTAARGDQGVNDDQGVEVKEDSVGKLRPEEVQVGPGQLTWIVLLPLFLTCAVVSYFVLTTE